MTWTNLPTNYTDAEYTGLRKYQMINNGDGTVSFQDVTDYSQEENSFFGAADANAMNGAINNIMTNGVTEDAPSDDAEYVRKNRAWVVNSGGAGLLTFYVNSSTGSDDNDGRSSSAPFKTVTKAINSLPPSGGYVHVQGTFSENISISDKQLVWFVFDDTTTFSNSIFIHRSYVYFYKGSGSVSVNVKNIDIMYNSAFHVDANVTLTFSNTLRVEYGSVVAIQGTVSINYSGYAVNVKTSYVYINTLNITGSSVGISSTRGAIVTYGTYTPTSVTTQISTDTGGRVYTGSQS